MKKTLFFIMIYFYVQLSYSQTLFLPLGLNGISISNNSNVGIGTSSPNAKLDIRGDVFLPYNNKLCFGSISDYGNRLKVWSNSQNSYIDYYQNLYLRTGLTSNSTKFTFTSDGKFGIASSEPTDLLQVGNGIGRLSGGMATGQNMQWGTSYIGFNAARNNGVWYIEGDGAHNGCSFIYGDIGGGINFVAIESTGSSSKTLTDIQICTATAFQIKASGLVKAKDFEVTLDGWPDFVFNSNHELLSIADLERFICINKHLPGIPTSDEVAKEGIRLGEMNKTLLQKIEELTLYIIQISNENKLLQIELNKIQMNHESNK